MMESKGQQVEYLLENLQKFIAEIKDESKLIKFDENGDPKWVRRCRGCRKKLTLRDEYKDLYVQAVQQSRDARQANRRFMLSINVVPSNQKHYTELKGAGQQQETHAVEFADKCEAANSDSED